MTLTVTGTSSGNHPLLTRIWAIAGHHLKTETLLVNISLTCEGLILLMMIILHTLTAHLTKHSLNFRTYSEIIIVTV